MQQKHLCHQHCYVVYTVANCKALLSSMSTSTVFLLFKNGFSAVLRCRLHTDEEMKRICFMTTQYARRSKCSTMSPVDTYDLLQYVFLPMVCMQCRTSLTVSPFPLFFNCCIRFDTMPTLP